MSQPASTAITLARPLARHDAQSLTDLCRTRPEEGARLIMALRDSNTAECPDTVFVRRDGDAIVKKVSARMVLRKSMGHIDTIAGEDTVTAAGYRHLNSLTGLHAISPSTVVVDGRAQPNPYVQLDAKGRPKVVYVRKCVIGPSPLTGRLVASDVSLRFDMDLYFLESLMAKVSKAREGGSLFALIGSDAMFPGPEGTNRALWSFVPIAMDFGAWINMTSPEMKDLLKDHISLMKFAERRAQTIAERNAYKAHPAMPASISAPDGVAQVMMVGWASAARGEIERIRQMIEEGTLEQEAEVTRQTITESQVTVEEMDHAADEASTEEEAAARDEKRAEEAKVKTNRTADRGKLLAEATEAHGAMVGTYGQAKTKEMFATWGLQGELSEADEAVLMRIIEETDKLVPF